MHEWSDFFLYVKRPSRDLYVFSRKSTRMQMASKTHLLEQHLRVHIINYALRKLTLYNDLAMQRNNKLHKV